MWCDGHIDRMTHRRKRVISIVPPLLHRVTNKKNSYIAFNHLNCFLGFLGFFVVVFCCCCCFFFCFVVLFFFHFHFQNGIVFHDVLIYSHVN